MNRGSDGLDDFPPRLAQAIRDIYRLRDACIASDFSRPSQNPLWPRRGLRRRWDRNYYRALNVYDVRSVMLREKLESIPDLLRILRSIDRAQQPRLYGCMVTAYLDFFKYDIKNPTMKTGLRRMVERASKRLSGDYLGGWRGY